MIIIVQDQTFEFTYFPFFRVKQKEDFHVYCMRLPSGQTHEVIVFDLDRPINCLREYSKFLIQEYVLEEDDALTPRAIQMKKDLLELLNHENRADTERHDRALRC